MYYRLSEFFTRFAVVSRLAGRAVASACVALAFLATPAAASEISVAGVTASSTFYTYNVNNLINGAGLVGDLHSGDWTGKWITNDTVTGWLTFDLGSQLFVGSTKIWNYGPGCCGNGRSTKDLGISYSADGLNYTSFDNVVLAQPTTDPFGGEAFNLGFTARYVKFALNSNYGDPYTGLSEVKFYNVAAVPEPETYGMMLAGLGLIGFIAARRKTI